MSAQARKIVHEAILQWADGLYYNNNNNNNNNNKGLSSEALVHYDDEAI